MAQQEHMAAAIPAIAAALVTFGSAKLTTVRGSAYTMVAFEGWPDSQADRPTAPGYAVVTAGDATDTPIAPRLQSQTTAMVGDVLTATIVWQVGTWEAPAQIDVFGRSKELRDEFARVTGEWLSDLPWDGGRSVTVAAYYNDKVRVLRGSSSDGDPDSPIAGEWRHTFSIKLSGRILQVTTLPVLQRAEVELNEAVLVVE